MNNKRERENASRECESEKEKNKVYKCKREPIYATPRRVTYVLTTPAPLASHSQQTSTPKIKDFSRNSLSQHNKSCDRRTIVEHIALNV